MVPFNDFVLVSVTPRSVFGDLCILLAVFQLLEEAETFCGLGELLDKTLAVAFTEEMKTVVSH